MSSPQVYAPTPAADNCDDRFPAAVWLSVPSDASVSARSVATLRSGDQIRSGRRPRRARSWLIHVMRYPSTVRDVGEVGVLVELFGTVPDPETIAGAMTVAAVTVARNRPSRARRGKGRARSNMPLVSVAAGGATLGAATPSLRGATSHDATRTRRGWVAARAGVSRMTRTTGPPPVSGIGGRPG